MDVLVYALIWNSFLSTYYSSINNICLISSYLIFDGVYYEQLMEMVFIEVFNKLSKRNPVNILI